MDEQKLNPIILQNLLIKVYEKNNCSKSGLSLIHNDPLRKNFTRLSADNPQYNFILLFEKK